ncbi:MAG: hypothetical protein NTW95_02675 [Candidatus Aminicenantes bacterium]|nr:hypothetical protein [Candidatus Aminicenantes bacterium]
MGNLKIMIAGVGISFKKGRLAFRLWAVNLLFSLFAVGPFFFLMMKHMSHSFSGERMLHKLDIFWLGDFIYRYMNVAPTVFGSMLLAIALYLLLTVFLNGGVIGCLNRPGGKTTLADFFQDCGLHFWSLLRLFLASIPVYLVFVGIGFSLIKALLEIIDRRAPTEWLALIVSNLRLLALVLLLTVVSMFFDYVKIGLVANGRKKVWQEIKRTARFLGRRFFSAWSLFLLAGLVLVALMFLYLEVARILPKDRPLWLLLVFLWQQFHILCRQWSKVLFYATELKFSRENMKETG